MYRNARGILEDILEAKHRELEVLRPRAAALRSEAEAAAPVRAFETVLRGPIPVADRGVQASFTIRRMDMRKCFHREVRDRVREGEQSHSAY